MKHQAFKKFFILIFSLGLLFTTTVGRVYAGPFDPDPGPDPDPTVFSCKGTIEDIGANDYYPGNQLLQLPCALGRVLNVLVLSAGVILGIIIAQASFKLSIAQGDAKAIQSAQQKLTWGVVGFLIIIGIYSISFIIAQILGVTASANPFEQLAILLAYLLNFIYAN